MTSPFGVYVHIPFCAHRCDYCAFATWTGREALIPAYVAACRTEAASLDRAATSVFFGGGTPSLLPGDALVSILATVDRAPGCEVTVECNPETVSASLLSTYIDGGVTRLSFGAQSMVPHVLEGLGRRHAPGAVADAVAAAKSVGFATWNVDLIFGGAGETDADFERSLREVIALGTPHVSAYALTVEPGTPLAAAPERHPDDDALANRYLLASRVLEGAGLVNYEISNWARPGHECRHNLLYWSQGDYRGVGCAAHSHVAGRRWWNVRTPERYIALMESGAPVEAGFEVLGAEMRQRERWELALRTRAGVPASAFSADDLALLRARGLVAGDGPVGLTREGRLLANEVAIRLR